jgi:hypothetical protein
MTASKSLAIALGYKPSDQEEFFCGLCGAYAPGKYWKDAIKSSNTSQADLKTQHICWACEACMNDSRTRSNALVLNDGSYRKPERKEIWQLILEPPEPPFVLYLTLTAHKHGIWRQHVARTKTAFRLQCEDYSCIFKPASDIEWMKSCYHLMLAGVRRDSVETGRYTSKDYLTARGTIKQHEPILQLVRGSEKWAIIFGLMPSREDLKGYERLLA